MALQTIEYLKSKFETGDLPDQNDFQDLIDSCYNLTQSDLSLLIITIVENITINSRNVFYDNTAGIDNIIVGQNVQDAITQLSFMVKELNNVVFPSPTPTPTPSITPTLTPSVTPSETPSETPSVTPTVTPTPTPTETPSLTPSKTPSVTPSETPSLTPSKTPSVTPSKTPSVTPSLTPTITPSNPTPFSLVWDNFSTLPTFSYTDTGSIEVINNSTQILLRPKSALLTFESSYNTANGDVNFSSCSNLTFLRLKDNGISSLNVYNCTSLDILDCSTNNLLSLDIISCSVLTDLDASGNQLNTVTLSGLTLLNTVNLEGNNISSLNVTNDVNLSSINIGYCNFNISDLDTLFNNLQDRTSSTSGNIDIYSNPGTSGANSLIAEGKNWVVNKIGPLNAQV